MKEQNNDFLVTEKVGRLMEKYALPCVISLLVGALYNIVDQIFIANAAYLGSYGNAANTVVFPLTVVALGIAVMIGDGCCAYCSISLGSNRPENASRSVGKTLSLGLCSFLAQISLVAAMAAINNMLRRYGAMDAIFGQTQYAQIPMAVVGIVMKFFQIIISIVIGMAAGCIPVVGFNMGAGRRARVRALFTRLLIWEACIGAAALVIVECFPGALIRIFGAANESSYYTAFAVKAFRVYLCMLVLACVNKATFIFLQAMGRAVESTLLSMVREIVFGVGFALLLPRFFGLDGVLYSMPVSDVLTAVISVIMIARAYRELRPNDENLKMRSC